MMSHKDKVNGIEYDMIYKAPLCLFDNISGIKKYWKNQINRRDRYKIKKELKDERINL